MQTKISLDPYATSAFQLHSLIATVYVVQGVVNGTYTEVLSAAVNERDPSQRSSSRLWLQLPMSLAGLKPSRLASCSMFLATYSRPPRTMLEPLHRHRYSTRRAEPAYEFFHKSSLPIQAIFCIERCSPVFLILPFLSRYG